MQLKRKIKRLAALVLAMSMALGCTPVGAWAEVITPTDLPTIIATDGEAVPEPTLPSGEQEAGETSDVPAPEESEAPDESADDSTEDTPVDNPQVDDEQESLPHESVDASP